MTIEQMLEQICSRIDRQEKKIDRLISLTLPTQSDELTAIQTKCAMQGKPFDRIQAKREISLRRAALR